MGAVPQGSVVTAQSKQAVEKVGVPLEKTDVGLPGEFTYGVHVDRIDQKGAHDDPAEENADGSGFDEAQPPPGLRA